MLENFQQELDELESHGLLRRCRRVVPLENGKIRVDGKTLLHLASNSYLGLHQHPRVIGRAVEATRRYGTGAGSARLIGGTLELHEELEEAIAAFKQAESALLFSTGYMANLGVVTALAGSGDLVIGDRLNHASLVDACRLSGATFRVYPHKDVERLQTILRQRRKNYNRVFIVTEGLFSMDGDVAPLLELAELADRYDVFLIVDDAHGTGVLGPHGRGSLEQCGVSPAHHRGRIIQVGTFSKALGSLGGFAAGPKVVIEFLRNKARSFIYTTALPAACAAASLEALRIVEEEETVRAQLWNNVRLWISGLERIGVKLISKESPIVSLAIGQTRQTMACAENLFENGFYAPGIRPPTVPQGQARIRTSITAVHAPADLDRALLAFEKIFAPETSQGVPCR